MPKVTKINANSKNVYLKPKLRTAAYCRVSTDSDEQLLSLEAQKLHYESFIKANPDWDFVGIYYDEGISGTKKENRTALMKLVADCEKRKIDLIITKSISRFARNTTDCLELVRKLTDLGIFIIFEKENIHTGAMDGELILTVLSSLAESESISISQNNKWGIKRRFQNGTYKQSCPPYGYILKDGVFIKEPAQAEIVKRIFNEALAGNGTAMIAKGLNADGIKSQRGGIWNTSSIKGMLVNERYTGDVLLQKTFTDDSFKRHYNRGQKDQYFLADVHEAIITREDFEKVGLLMEQRGKEKGICKDNSKYNNRYVFSGRIICSECGGTFKRRIHTKNKNQQYIAWCCSKHIDDVNSCKMLFIREEDIKDAFITMINKLYAGRNIVLKPMIQTLKNMDKSGTLEKVMELEKLTEENMERGNVLSTLAAKGYIDPVHFNKQNNEIKAEATRLKEQKAALVLMVSGEQSSLSQAEKLLKHLNRQNEALSDFNEEVFIDFVEKIVVYSPTEIGFKLNCGILLKEGVRR